MVLKRSLPFVIVVVAAVLVTLISKYERSRNEEIVCGDNLEYIGMGIHNYHDYYRRFPSPDADGHSWRIRIVPFLFASAMYEQYRFDEPWDSENNITLDSRPLPVKDGGPDRPHGMPFPYECSQDADSRSMTAFLMFVGENAFGKPGGYRHRDEITDSLDCTLVAAETIPTTIHWLEPRDFDVESISFRINDSGAPSISSTHPRGPAVLFADGQVFRISPDIDANTVRAMTTINGGEAVDRNRLIDGNILREY
jgi:hypothetical protein